MEDNNILKAIEEIKNSDEENLKKIIEDWFEKTRTSGMKIGASYISLAIYDAMKKHIIKKEKVSLRDYKRMSDDIAKIISVPLTQQNDSTEETSNDE